MRLKDNLFDEAKRFAAETGRTFTALIEDTLRGFIAREMRPEQRRSPRLTTVGGRGLQPGVDLDNAAGLLELMQRGDGTA